MDVKVSLDQAPLRALRMELCVVFSPLIAKCEATFAPGLCACTGDKDSDSAGGYVSIEK